MRNTDLSRTSRPSKLRFKQLSKSFEQYAALIFASLILLTTILWPRPVYANSAEPPALIILVNNAPEDLTVELKRKDTNLKGREKSVAWESYYAFYFSDLSSTRADTLVISTAGSSFEIKFEPEPDRYTQIYTLNLKQQTLSPGTALWRTLLLVGIRVILTLLIEGFIFLLFGYRSKRSWLVFLIINLLTQGTLNVLLSGSYNPFANPYFGLIILEFLILIFEAIFITIFIKEHQKWRAFLFAILANIASFVLGFFLIMNLPL